MADGEKNGWNPETEPYDSGTLKVSDLHTLYYEQCGNSKGKPVIFVHGGPGVGCRPSNRRFFDPAAYRVILLDQRGAGKSTPMAELKENTSWDLVSDMEKLREHLRIDKWMLFGGSWGSALSLLYAETHPDKVTAMVLSGIFTCRWKEAQWLYQEGCSYIYPDVFEEFVKPIPEVERGDLLGAYHRRLTGDDEDLGRKCAMVWSRWELSTLTLIQQPELIKLADNAEFCLKFARLESHYFVNGFFLEKDGQILNNIDRIRHIPCTIVQGRYDVICPMKTAWELHKRWPEADFHIDDASGHIDEEPGLMKKLVQATEKYKHM